MTRRRSLRRARASECRRPKNEHPPRRHGASREEPVLILTGAPSEVFSRKRNRNPLNLFTQIRAEVSNIARQQVSGASFDRREQDRQILLWQRNPAWKRPLGSLKQMNES